MEARLVGEQKQLKDSIAALVSHMQSGQTILPALPAAISNIITTSSNSNEAGPTSVMNVLEGSLQVGFVTSNPENHLINKVLKKGDVFIFPIGLVHYQRSMGYGNVISIVALSTQNPGVISIANAVFGSEPPIPTYILAKAFQVDESVASLIQSKF
ncbi:Germin-like protein 8-2 [Capsicum chinense]|nr:Germin-like protein 8-2 [Capsicum chinense]